MLSQLLTEIDGVQRLSNVVLVAATNRPDRVDAALLRPGRIDRALYLGPPDKETRLEILKIHTRNTPHDDKDLEMIAGRTEGFSGADLSGMCSMAALAALRENIDATAVTWAHWERVLKSKTSSLSSVDLSIYETFRTGSKGLSSI